MKIKCGRQEFDLTKNDVILDNGACFQIMTRKVFKGWSDYPPVVSKVLARKLIKNGDLVLKEEKVAGFTALGVKITHKYYGIKEN